MIVVADTSPINYLLQIKLESLLEVLYEEIMIPSSVILELRDVRAPRIVQGWAANPPVWLTVRDPSEARVSQLQILDAGEAAALQLALEIEAETVLVDEWKATSIGRELGLNVTGTLGVLREAHQRKLIDGLDAYTQLVTQTNFRVSSRISKLFLATLLSPL